MCGTQGAVARYSTMPRFYFHLCNGQGLVEDHEGTELPDLTSATSHAITSLRDVLASEVKRGQINLAAFIDIEDEQQARLVTIHFTDAIQVETKNKRSPR